MSGSSSFILAILDFIADSYAKKPSRIVFVGDERADFMLDTGTDFVFEESTVNPDDELFLNLVIKILENLSHTSSKLMSYSDSSVPESEEETFSLVVIVVFLSGFVNVFVPEPSGSGVMDT